MPGVVTKSGADILHQITVNLLSHAHGDDDRVSSLVTALDAVQELYRLHEPLVTIPEPTDLDPRLLALKASVIERLVEVWRTPPHDRSDERAPSWCVAVPPLPEPLWLIDRDLADFGLNAIFEPRGIMALPNFLLFA